MSDKPLDEQLMATSENLYSLACEVGKLEAENKVLKNMLNKIYAVVESVDTSTDSCDRLHHNISIILHENTN